jgi:hypothetical protein
MRRRVVVRLELDVDVDAWLDHTPPGSFELTGPDDVPDDVLAWALELVEYSRMSQLGAVGCSHARKLAR